MKVLAISIIKGNIATLTKWKRQLYIILIQSHHHIVACGVYIGDMFDVDNVHHEVRTVDVIFEIYVFPATAIPPWMAFVLSYPDFRNYAIVCIGV